MKTGGLIVVAGLSSRMHDFKPLMKIGEKTLIQRVVETFLTVGLAPLVVVTGFRGAEVEQHLKGSPVVCIRNEAYETTQMFDSIKIGFQYLLPRCDSLLFTPGDIPLFSSQTVQYLLRSNKKLAKPACQGRGGHPLLMSTDFIPQLLTCQENGGLKAALKTLPLQVETIEVDDKGILLDADTQADYEALLAFYKAKQ